jgi:hypothetical protein
VVAGHGEQSGEEPSRSRGNSGSRGRERVRGGESGRGHLHYNHTRWDKVVPTWDGGDRREPFKKPLWLTSAPGSISYFQSFSII